LLGGLGLHFISTYYFDIEANVSPAANGSCRRV
jgi:hypothetical protein